MVEPERRGESGGVSGLVRRGAVTRDRQKKVGVPSPAPAGVAPVVEEGRLPSVVAKVAVGVLGRVPTASV